MGTAAGRINRRGLLSFFPGGQVLPPNSLRSSCLVRSDFTDEKMSFPFFAKSEINQLGVTKIPFYAGGGEEMRRPWKRVEIGGPQRAWQNLT